MKIAVKINKGKLMHQKLFSISFVSLKYSIEIVEFYAETKLIKLKDCAKSAIKSFKKYDAYTSDYFDASVVVNTADAKCAQSFQFISSATTVDQYQNFNHLLHIYKSTGHLN